MKYFSYIVIGVVGAAVVAGFFIIGSPANERLRKYDERRISNLQFLQSEIINYWTWKGKLPATIDMIQDDVRGFPIPIDPQVGPSYGYYAKDEDTFSLCADFVTDTKFLEERPFPLTPGSKPSLPEIARYPYNQNWEHEIGYQCFERTIDKDIYKPQSKADFEPR